MSPSARRAAAGGEPAHSSGGASTATAPAGFLIALAVGIGGALGALSRVGLSEWLGGDTFATSTLIVTLVINTLGALALGVLRRPHAIKPGTVLSAGVSVGFLGAFTTWSAVMVQLALLQGAGSWLIGIGYLLVTLALGLAAAWWGLRLGVGNTVVAL